MKKNILVSVDRGETRVAVLEGSGSPPKGGGARRQKAAPGADGTELPPEFGALLRAFERHLAASRGLSPHTVRAYASDAGSLLAHVDRSGVAQVAVGDAACEDADEGDAGPRGRVPTSSAISSCPPSASPGCTRESATRSRPSRPTRRMAACEIRGTVL